MASIRRLLLNPRTPLVEARRHRGKFNIQRPQKLHYQRKLMMELCKPTYPSKMELPAWRRCADLKPNPREEIDNPYEHILAKECLNWFNHSRMVAVYHANPLPANERTKIFAQFKAADMYMMRYGKKVVGMALKGTPYEAMTQLFHSHNELLFSEKVDAAQLMKVTRKAKQLILLGGIIDGRIVSKNEITEYSQVKDISVVQSQLCHVLDSVALDLVSKITQPQNSIIYNLTAFADEMKKAAEKPDSVAAVEESKT